MSDVYQFISSNKKQFFIKSLSSAVNLLMLGMLSFILPRSVSVEELSQYALVISVFGLFSQLAGLGVGSGYTNLLSQSPANTRYYNSLALTHLLLVVAILGLIYSMSAYAKGAVGGLWEAIPDGTILLGAIWFALQNLQNRLSEYADVKKNTTEMEISKLTAKAAIVGFCLIFFLQESLTIEIFLQTNVLFVLFQIIHSIWVLRPPLALRGLDKIYALQLIRYCAPLVPFVFISAVYPFIGRALLSSGTDPEQLGLFHFAFQLAIIPAAVLTPILPIIQARLVEVIHQIPKNIELRLMLGLLAFVFFIYLLVGSILQANSDQLILLVGGEKYLNSIKTFDLLVFYVVFQSLTQISTTILLAKSETKSLGLVNTSVLSLGTIAIIFVAGNSALDSEILAGIMLGFIALRGLALVLIILRLYVNNE